MRAATLGLLAIAVVLAGCASDVDKCVAAWEEAHKNVPDDDSLQFRRQGYGKNTLTKSQARFAIRKECMEAAKGGSE